MGHIVHNSRSAFILPSFRVITADYQPHRWNPTDKATFPTKHTYIKNVEKRKRFILSKKPIAKFHPHQVTGASQRASQPSQESGRIQINNFQLFWGGEKWSHSVQNCTLQNRVVFYNQDAVFWAWAIPKQTITLPEERRRKQRNIRPYNYVIASLNYNTRFDVVPWILISWTKPGFTAVDAFVTQYHTKQVCTAFLLWMFWCYCLHKFILISFPSKNSSLSSMLEA